MADPNTNPVQAANQATAPFTIPKSWEELSKELDAIARNAGKEAAADEIKDFVEREISENKRLTETQRARKFFKAMKSAGRDMGRGNRSKSIRGLNQIQELDDPDEVIGVKTTRALPLLARFKGNVDQAVDHAKKNGYGDMEKILSGAGEKILNATDYTAGGAVLPTEVSSDIIGMLYANSLVRSMGAVVIPNPGGDLIMPKQTGSVSGYWIGENQRVNVSEIKLGAIKLGTKEVSIAIPISQHLSRLADGDFNQLIYNDASRVLRNTEDRALIRSAGSQWSPSGIDAQMASANKFAANPSNLFADVVADLFKLQYRVEGGNDESEGIEDPIAPGFMISKREAFFLKSQITSDGTFVWLPQMMQGQLIDAPWGASTHIPKNLGGGGDESEIYYGDFAHLLIGQVMSMTARLYPGAAFIDASGNPVYGAQQATDLLVVNAQMDMRLRHDVAFY